MTNNHPALDSMDIYQYLPSGTVPPPPPPTPCTVEIHINHTNIYIAINDQDGVHKGKTCIQ